MIEESAVQVAVRHESAYEDDEMLVAASMACPGASSTQERGSEEEADALAQATAGDSTG